MRDTVFISHATPDDNDFVRWLGARLIGNGYKVWADLLELKGGTPFWMSIEEALRSRAAKVIFVVSEKSVDKAKHSLRNADCGHSRRARTEWSPFAEAGIQVPLPAAHGEADRHR